MIGSISIWMPHEEQFRDIQKLENLTSIVILGEVEFHYDALLNNKKLLLDIIEMKFIDMKIDFESGSDGYEFYFSLRKNN